MHMKGASGCRQRIMHDPRAQHPGQMFLPGSGFLRGRKTGVPREKPPSQVEINRGSAYMIAEVGGTNFRIRCQPDFQDFKEWIALSMMVSKTQGQAPVVQKVDHAIHWTMILSIGQQFIQ